MRSTVLLTLLAVAMVLPLAAQAETVRDTEEFYLHRAAGSGTSCGTDLYLDRFADVGDAGCTPTFRVGNTIFEDSDNFALRASELPLTIDALTNLTGEITMVADPGLADFDLIVTITGTEQGKILPHTLGTGTTHMTLAPTMSDTFAFDFDIDDALDGVVLSGITVNLSFANTFGAGAPSYGLDGASFIEMPFQYEVTSG